MDIWASIWPNPDVNGKVHKSVVRAICDKMDLSVRWGHIYTMVELHGISDDLDKLATTRQIRAIRDARRIAGGWYRKAICA